MRRFCFALALACGCSYPEFAFNDAAPAPVAETAVPDTAIEDTAPSIESSVADTGVILDSEAPPPKGCDGTTATFCVDFSKSVEPHDGWTGKKVATNATLNIENTSPFSAPNNLIAFVKADPTGYLDAAVYKTLTAPALEREARIDFRLRVPAKPGPGGRYYLLRYHRDDAGDGFGFVLDGGGFFLEIHGGSYSERRTMMAVPVDTWMHVRIDAVLKYTNGSARVWIDDMVNPVMEIADVSTTETDSLTRRLTVGIFGNTPPNDLWARYDDVSFSWK